MAGNQQPMPPNPVGQNPNYRHSAVSERPPQQLEAQADGQGRASPQPASDRGENDPEKALKDLGTFLQSEPTLFPSKPRFVRPCRPTIRFDLHVAMCSDQIQERQEALL